MAVESGVATLLTAGEGGRAERAGTDALKMDGEIWLVRLALDADGWLTATKGFASTQVGQFVPQRADKAM